MQYVQLASFRDDKDRLVLGRESKLKLLADELVALRQARGPGAYSTRLKPAEGSSFFKSERDMSPLSVACPAPNKYNANCSGTPHSAFSHHCYRQRVAMISSEEAIFARAAAGPAPTSYNVKDDCITSARSPKALLFARSTRWKVKDTSNAVDNIGPQTYFPHVPVRETNRAPLFDGYACRPCQNLFSGDTLLPSPAHYNYRESYHALKCQGARTVISNAPRFMELSINLGPGPAAEEMHDTGRTPFHHKARAMPRKEQGNHATKLSRTSLINLRESEARRNVREHCIKL